MRRFGLFSAVCLCLTPHLASGSTMGSLEAEINSLFEKVNPSVVTVKYGSGSGGFKELVSTGVIIDAKGHILTLRDFPSDPKRVEVVLFDGKKRKAEFIGYDPESKVQILKTDKKGLSLARVGDPKAVKGGNLVLIVGNSYGISPSLSIGFISGRREKDLIQLSGEVSPGMSGAGIFNTKGELVGIVSATISRPFYFTLGGVEGGIQIRKGMDLPSQGPGLVLSIDRAMKLAKEIIKKGGVEHGWLGVYLRGLDKDLKEELKTEKGAVVTRVVDDSPAEEAGIEEDDAIIEYGGKKVADVENLSTLVKETKPGKKVKVTVLRDGKRKTLVAKIGKRTWQEVFRPLELLPFIKEPLEKYPYFDEEKLKEELRELQKELRELKKELRNLKKKEKI